MQTTNLADMAASSNSWLWQSPLFGGYAATVATLPSARLTIAAVVTSTVGRIDDGEAALPNRADAIVRSLATVLSPDDAPAPVRVRR